METIRTILLWITIFEALAAAVAGIVIGAFITFGKQDAVYFDRIVPAAGCSVLGVLAADVLLFLTKILFGV